jgi:ABC-type cobalamin/Fe3+-siderophores transport system ATPase subunit
LAAYHLFCKAGFWNSVFNTPISKKEEGEFMEDALETLRFFGIEDLKNEIAKNLPYGHQRAMTLGMALILKPRVLMLDELVSGMKPQETKNMMDKIKETRVRDGECPNRRIHGTNHQECVCGHRYPGMQPGLCVDPGWSRGYRHSATSNPRGRDARGDIEERASSLPD